MPAPDYFTWDFVLPGQPARAASVDDLGGAQLQDDAAYPPVPPEMPYANQLNQWALQLGGVNRVIEALDLEIAIAPSLAIVRATGMADQLTTSYCQANFTVSLFSTGVVTIAWPAGVLPPPRARSRAWITDPNPYAAPVVESLAPNTLTVYTWDAAGTPTNAPFVLSIY